MNSIPHCPAHSPANSSCPFCQSTIKAYEKLAAIHAREVQSPEYLGLGTQRLYSKVQEKANEGHGKKE